MYGKRIKVFIFLCAVFLLAFLLRLSQMQLRDKSFYQDKIHKLKIQQGLSRLLRTVRGRILDRNGKILAADESRFMLHINYRLTCFMDERVRQAKLKKAAKQRNASIAMAKAQEEIDKGLKDLQQVIDKCVSFGLERTEIEDKIEKINNRVWNLRTFVAWRRNEPTAGIIEKYRYKIADVPFSQALADFEKKFPDADRRLLLIDKVDDIAEANKNWPLLELKTDDDIFTAQVEFMDISGVEILPKAQRIYPYDNIAAQTVGWVGAARPADDKLFAGDRLAGYLDDDICGREDGTEYVCETVLRGKRGEVVYDVDRREISRTETQFGEDISLTIDIELQKKIENCFTDCGFNANCKAPMAGVVIDVATGDILALVSMPDFDLNRVRSDYAVFESDPHKPLINRVLNRQYPPGSVIKPLILIAGLESGRITAGEVITCPAQPAPKGWPDCWVYNRYHTGHSDKWHNNAHNAIKGSCNIYFSHLADRIEPMVLQGWLFDFGYGRKILPPFADTTARNFRQMQGQISNNPPNVTVARFEQVPPLDMGERRYFGIGQGNLRVTPLQVANAMAAIARGGLYKLPQLVIKADANAPSDSTALNISPQTLDTIRDGMSAVVNEDGGTAYDVFAGAGFSMSGVKVYGKTGSTEVEENAWFAGFAEDSKGRSVAVAVVVEGGQHGATDAGPLARQMIRFCIEAGYIGPNQPKTE
jgi:penicillin-binding protein 2